VTLIVYDVLGREVERVLSDHRFSAGVHRVVLENQEWPSGVYVYRLRAGAFEASRQMTVVR